MREREAEIEFLLQKMLLTCPLPPKPPSEAAVPVATYNPWRRKEEARNRKSKRRLEREVFDERISIGSG